MFTNDISDELIKILKIQNKSLYNNRIINDKNVLNKYKKINLLSDTIVFYMVIFIQFIFCLILYYNIEEALIYFILFMPSFIFAYIFCVIRIKNYNNYLSKCILVKGSLVNDIHIIEKGLKAGKIEAWYRYIDPKGKEHISRQETYMFLWEVPYSKQLLKWQSIYNKNTEIDILIDFNEFNYSYLPLRENYCKKFNKIYSVDLHDFENL